MSLNTIEIIQTSNKICMHFNLFCPVTRILLGKHLILLYVIFLKEPNFFCVLVS
jgi:hypothetical protein